MTALSISRTEIDRLHVVRDLSAKRIRTKDAEQLLGVTRRQVSRASSQQAIIAAAGADDPIS